MKRTHDQLRAELMAAAEEVIDELLEWHERSEAPTLTEIEDAVLDLRRRLEERMQQAVVEDQEAIHPVPGPACPTCGREMRYKGMKKLAVSGRTGDLELERAYFYCGRCRSGLFPPGSTTEAEAASNRPTGMRARARQTQAGACTPGALGLRSLATCHHTPDQLPIAKDQRQSSPDPPTSPERFLHAGPAPMITTSYCR